MVNTSHARGDSAGQYELATMSDSEVKEVGSVTIDEPIERRHVRYLKRPISELILDFILALVPWLFIGLIVTAGFLRYGPVSDDGRRIKQALNLGPSLFPIVFAALCGHFMKSLALYKSQSGLRMRHMEHLVGAQSIFASFERLFFLGNWNAIGLAIVLTWCLSPLGGQALLRLLDTKLDHRTTTETVSYISPDILSYTDVDGGVSGTTDIFPLIDTIYMSSLSAPQSVRDSKRDLWNNAKIPLLTTGSSNSSGKPENASYFNLIGIPIGGLSANTDVATSFKGLESISLSVTCTSSNRTTLKNFTTALNEPLYNISNPSLPGILEWQHYYNSFESQAGYPTSFLASTNRSVSNFLTNITNKIEVYYGTWIEHTTSPDDDGSADLDVASITACDVSPVRLTSSVFCYGQLCNITASNQIPTNFTLDHQQTLIMTLLSGLLPGIANGGGTVSTPTTLFLSDPITALTPYYGPGGSFAADGSAAGTSLSNIPLATLSQRMSLVLNAYYYASTANWIWTNDPASTTKGYATQFVKNVSAQVVTPRGEVYEIRQQWFVIALLTSLMLVVISFGNIWLRWKTSVPDVFGYVSSLTLHNELCNESGLARSSALDGLERAAELGEVKFRIADIRSDRDVGRMAFVPISDDTNDQRLHGDVKLGRMYD